MTHILPSRPDAVPMPARAGLSPTTLNLAVAAFIMAVDNRTFWSRGVAIFDESWLSLVLFGGAVWAMTLFLLTLFGFRWLQKPVAVFALMLSAVTSYFMDTLGVMIDRDMIQNAVTTTVAESKHLLTPDFLLHVLLFGVLPSVLVLAVRLRPSGFWRNALGWAGMTLASFALFAGLLAVDFKTVSAVLRERKELIGSYQPGAPLGGAVRYAKMMLKSQTVSLAPLGTDAVKGPLLRAAGKPAAEIAAFSAEMGAMAEQYRNPLFRMALTLTEIFPVALLVSIVSAALLRKSSFLPATQPRG